MLTREIIHQFIEKLNKEPLIKKNLCKCAWLSGSSTYVHPIEIRIRPSENLADEVILQWESDRCCDKFIQRIVKSYPNVLKKGHFCRSGGSCPNTIVLYLKEKIED